MAWQTAAQRREKEEGQDAIDHVLLSWLLLLPGPSNLMFPTHPWLCSHNLPWLVSPPPLPLSHTPALSNSRKIRHPNPTLPCSAKRCSSGRCLGRQWSLFRAAVVVGRMQLSKGTSARLHARRTNRSAPQYNCLGFLFAPSPSLLLSILAVAARGVLRMLLVCVHVH